MRTPVHRALKRLALVPLALGVVVGCSSGPVVFAGNAALSVVGNPPPPAPAPPARVELKEDRIEIHEKIQFDFNQATIKEVSFGLLDEVAAVIKKNPQIKKISIEGHASAEGGADYNMSLSDRRAKAVMKYLVDHGIAQGVLAAQGFGVTRPLADNETAEGREKNRRVEFNITEQDRKQQQVQTNAAAAQPASAK